MSVRSNPQITTKGPGDSRIQLLADSNGISKSQDYTSWYANPEKAMALLKLAREVSSLRHGTAMDESTCKLCMRPSGADFYVRDKDWAEVIGIDTIVCRECFGLAAQLRNVTDFFVIGETTGVEAT